MKKTIFFLFFSIIVCGKSYSQPSNTPPNARPGKCYAKCTIPSNSPNEAISPAQSQWEEVVCGEKITPQLIQNLRSALIREGFTKIKSAEFIDSDMKEALNAFQKKSNLPIGNLNIKTMEALGIMY